MAPDGLGIFLYDLLTIFSWWSGLFITGLIFFPWCTALFRDWPDRGYSFAKPLGMLVGGYFCWLLAVLQILPFSSAAIYLVLAGFALITFAQEKARADIVALFRQQSRILVTRELLFVALLIIGALIRGQNPDISGLEKFMDFGFINSCLRSPFMPPSDPWFAGKTINYYYFGHFMAAWLIKMTQVMPDVGYNLMVATIFAMTFTISYSLIAALAKAALGDSSRLSWNLAGLVGALLTACGGNFHAFWKWFLPLIGIPFFAAKPFYYPDSTRFIGHDPSVDDKTIHEFPLYSFIVSDLHGHLNNLPLVILFIALLFAGWQRSSGYFNAIPVWPFFPLYALSIAVFSMTNPWDVPIYLLMGIFTVIISSSKQPGLMNHGQLPQTAAQQTWTEWGRLFLPRAAIIVLGFPVFAYPFARTFKSFSSGVGVTFTHTPAGQFLMLWGAHLLFAVIFIFWLLRPVSGDSGLRNRLQSSGYADRFCLILVLTGICLLIVPELIYVKDIYSRSYYRSNTMFKFTYQSFIILSLAAGFIFARVPCAIKSIFAGRILRILFILAAGALLLYGIPAVTQAYGGISLKKYRGQEGLHFLDRNGPGDLQAVKWLNDNVIGQPAILEAFGDSYTDYARISMATGLPTLMGWEVHQWLWRGNGIPNLLHRSHVVFMYESGNLEMVKSLLKKYEIRYIIVGALERKKFANLHEYLFKSNFHEVFSDKETKIYRVAGELNK